MSDGTDSKGLVLVCISGPDAGKRIAVKSKPVTIGTSAACEIASDDADVLERHATVKLRNGKVFFEAVGEARVYLDGERMTECDLATDEQLRIGRSLWHIEGSGGSGDIGSFLGNLGEKISEVAGTEKIEGFNAGNMFSEVLRKRTDEEMEEYFAVGTPTTTPKLADVNTSWPKPWLFVKIFVLAGLVYLGLVFVYQTFNNQLMLPALLVMGAFVMPFTLLIFFFEVNVLRNVPLYQILKMLFLGGVLSVLLALVLYQVTGWGATDSWFSAVGKGIVEEAGKVAALLLIVNKLKYRWILNGMLFGAAVGAGFAAFESAGYAYSAYGNVSVDNSGGVTWDSADMLHSITERGLLCICGGHVLWCSLTGGALWRVRGERKFEWAMLADMRFVRIFGLSAAMHAIWDSPLSEAMSLKFIALGFVVWVAVLSLIQMGLKQIREAQAAGGATEFFRKQVTTSNA